MTTASHSHCEYSPIVPESPTNRYWEKSGAMPTQNQVLIGNCLLRFEIRYFSLSVQYPASSSARPTSRSSPDRSLSVQAAAIVPETPAPATGPGRAPPC